MIQVQPPAIPWASLTALSKRCWSSGPFPGEPGQCTAPSGGKPFPKIRPEPPLAPLQPRPGSCPQREEPRASQRCVSTSTSLPSSIPSTFPAPGDEQVPIPAPWQPCGLCWALHPRLRPGRAGPRGHRGNGNARGRGRAGAAGSGAGLNVRPLPPPSPASRSPPR